MSGMRRMAAAVLALVAVGCGGPSIEGQWSGRASDGRSIGYTFAGDGSGAEARGDTVREFRFHLDERYDPPRLELAGTGWTEEGVVRLLGDYEMRLRLTQTTGNAPHSFTPDSPGVLLLRREMR